MTSFPHFLKLKCWEILQKFSKLEYCFSQRDAEWNLSDTLLSELEEYICNLYGYREKNINKVRWLLSQEKHAKENLVINLTVLPPCLNVFRIYSERANFVIKVWKSSLKKKLMKRVSQITAGMNMVIFGGLTNHFLMILVEYFSIIYTITNNMILEAIMKKERIKMKITSYLVTVDLVLNTGSDIYLNQLFFITTY